MSAIVIPFRFARRINQIQETAAYLANLDVKHADGHLRYQLRRLEEGLRRKGVAEDLIEYEVTSYAKAVRETVNRIAPFIGGAA